MPFTQNWYIENEIIYNYGHGEITADELKEHLISTNQLIASSPRAVVHTINDVGDITQPLPPRETMATTFQYSPKDTTGWNIILREKSVLVKMGVAITTSLFKTHTKSCDTLEEVEAFLKRMDTDLSWEKADKSILPDY